MTATEIFAEKAPGVMRRLMADFDLTDIQAAGILGNLAHESGLRAVQEVHPIGGGRGGFGWAQWTGPRRVAFEDYCQRTHQDPKSDTANYAYLWRELSGHQEGFDYRKSITELKKTTTLSDAVTAFERSFEKANPKYKHYAERDKWAERALVAYRKAIGGKGLSDEVKRIQEKLTALGHPVVADGIVGKQTLAAIAAALGA